jgi:hypothetical protein
MTRSEDTIWCDGCGTEIRWSPYIYKQQDYCCRDCAYGISCKCSETMDLDEEYRDTAAPTATSYSG